MKPIITTEGISDYQVLDRWLKEIHGDRIKSSVFTGIGYKPLTFSDDNGPIMFVRLADAKRVDIQFSPNEQPSRTGRALAELVKYADRCPEVREFLFQTNVPKLARFMSRFGVEHDPFTYKLILEK